MDSTDMSNNKLNSSYIYDYLDGGLFDHLQMPGEFARLMRKRHWFYTEFYLTGISNLEAWYGEKHGAWKQYFAWFNCLDQMLDSAAGIFMGNYGAIKGTANIERKS